MKEKQPGKRPDYEVSVLNKRTDKKGIVGAAWVQENGSISLQFNPFVVLDFSDPDLVVMLFKTRKSKDQDHGIPF